jgi:hypothetical protein
MAMADYGLFIGWGTSVRGREAKALDSFNQAMEYYGRLQNEGRIESFEVGILEPHGGDLAGFALIRGERQKLSQLRVDPEFERLTTRAVLVVDGLGVIGASLGDGLGQLIATYQEELVAMG